MSKALFLAGLALCSLAGIAAAVSVPASDPMYVQQTDMATFNWNVLNVTSGGAIPVPDLPTGNNVAPFVRIFSNGNTSQVAGMTDPVKWQGGLVPYAAGVDNFNLAQSARFWYGLEYDEAGGQPETGDLITEVLTANALLARIQAIDPGSVTPIFAFDQNQVQANAPWPLGDAASGNDPVLPADWGTAPAGSVLPPGTVTPATNSDIWLKGRLILLAPTAAPGGSLAGLIGLSAADLNGLVDPLIAGGDPRVTVFTFADDQFLDFPDFLNPGSPNWSHLPGEYTVEDPNNPGTFITVNNNGNAHDGDWGGFFFPDLDLNNYPGYAAFMELQIFLDTDGQEEAYIIGGFGPQDNLDGVPEPLTIATAGLGMAGLIRYLRRRRLA